MKYLAFETKTKLNFLSLFFYSVPIATGIEVEIPESRLKDETRN